MLLLACPKSAPGPNLGGSDHERMDSLASQFEEYGSKSVTDCSETCNLKPKICQLSEQVCEIPARNTDRPEYQKRCIGAQEECARFNEACSACKK